MNWLKPLRFSTRLPPIPESVPGLTSTPASPPPSTAPHRESPPPPPPEPIPDEVTGLDQEQQAAALEEAAQQGVPLCEECMKAQAERESALTSA